MLNISGFLHDLADSAAAVRAENGRGFIDEEEIETMPENLNNVECLLDRNIQSAAKKFFTDDAWLHVMNTLKMVEGINYCKFMNKAGLFFSSPELT